MALPTTDTHVLYPAGETSADGVVVHVQPVSDGRVAVLLDRTPFHPLDAAWPDHGPDRGDLVRADGRRVVIHDAVVAATDGGRLVLGADIPVRTGTPGWVFAVAHLVDAGDAPADGEAVRVEVDAEYRKALSIGHTACHLAAFALDRALADAWSKDVPTDSLGAAGFDALAIQESRILQHAARDVYRIGKSMRKKGFDPAAFDDPRAVASRVDAVLAEWVATGGAVRIEAPDAALSARRTWECELPEGTARVPCGGTHVSSLAELSAITVQFEVSDEPGARTVVMHTTATPAETGGRSVIA